MLQEVSRLNDFRTWLLIRRWIESRSPDVVQFIDAKGETLAMIVGNEHGLLQTGQEWYWEWLNRVQALSDDEFAHIRNLAKARHWDCERNLYSTG